MTKTFLPHRFVELNKIVVNTENADAFVESLTDSATAETGLATGDLLLFSDISANDGRKMTLTTLQNFLNGLTFTEGLGPHHLQNAGFTSTVAGNANTIALKGKDLSDPSLNNAVYVAFQNAIIATGNYTIIKTTTATSIVIPSGATLGFTSSEDGYVYLYGINNAGTMELAVAKKALWQEHQLASTTAISAAADSDDVLYSTTARTDVPVRLLGRQRITTEATPGEWGTGPTELIVRAPAMKKTGDIIQRIDNLDSALATGGTAIPIDDTIPQQSTEGALFISQAITPKSTINLIKIEADLMLSMAATAEVAVALFQDSIENALSVMAADPRASGSVSTIKLEHVRIADPSSSTPSSITYKIHAGGNAGATVTFNGAVGGRYFGGAAGSILSVTEIQA